MSPIPPYRPYKDVLASKPFGRYRIRKVTLNGGFTCPNLDGSKGRAGCSYCDNRSFSPVAGASRSPAGQAPPVSGQLERGIAFLAARYGAERFIAYFQPYSNTYAPPDRLRALYAEALSHPLVVGLAIGTRPDCVDPGVVEVLEECAARAHVSLELGLQSAWDHTLAAVNRGHGFADFARAMDLCRGRGFDLGVHVILGLPGEDPGHWAATARALGRWRYQSLKIHPLHVVEGTPLATRYRRGAYRPLEAGEYVSGLVDFLERVDPEVGLERFTGDAPGPMLLAPGWCREKAAIREAMLAEFARRGTRQGALFPGPPTPAADPGP